MQVFMRELRARTFLPLVLLLGLFALGTVGYYVIGWGKWSLLKCAFMTSITLSTVGYGDVLQIFNSSPIGVVFTMFLILVGMGIVLYSVSVITAFLVEEGFSVLFLEHRMLNKIKKLDNHYIVAGSGTLGENVVHEFDATGTPYVVVDQDQAKVELLASKVPNMLYIVADAMQDNVLQNAGISRAKGLVACLPNDQENLYLTVTSKILNPNILVAARASTADSREKLKRVGADRVVSANEIGGLRLASEVLRPEVVTFLENMLRDRANYRLSQLTISASSPYAGKSLKESRLHQEYGVLVLAAAPQGSEDFTYSPNGDFVLQADMVLIVLGDQKGVAGAQDANA
jgi:voltage-gated potassium channel